MNHIRSVPLVIAAIVLMVSQFAFSQSFARMTAEPWHGTDFVSTYDHPIFENTGHLKNTTADAQMDFWDSFGRVRFDKQDPDSPFIAYRAYTSNLSTDSQLVHQTMDEFDLGLGLHWGTVGDWKIDSMLGAGYGSTRPFVNANGI